MADEVKNPADVAENVQQDVPAADETPTQPDTAEEATVVAEEAAPADEVVVEEVPVDQYSHLKTGQVVRVHLKIKDITPKGEERERIQIFEGTIIAVKGRDAQSRTITVRKISGGIGVERIFPLKMPTIAKIEVVKMLKIRRSKLYFLRNTRKKIREVKK